MKSISATSQNGLIRIRHLIEPGIPSGIETSMKPFLDNGHVDKTHKMRVQFKGSHSLKITTQSKSHGEKITRLQVPPVYKFENPKGMSTHNFDTSGLHSADFIEFQNLLLNKEVKFCADVQHIKSLEKEAQCRLGTIRILLEPFSRTRHLLYFRHTSDQKPGFVEWPGKQVAFSLSYATDP